jgi:hypothetical protein
MTRVWTRIKQFLRIGGDGEPALVRNRPRRPLLSGSVALEIPGEPDDVDAQGYEVD